ncbi:hypothetical protein ACFQH6_12560 [Halobacteriaceae archaeon GCM10025711]
MSLDVPGRLLGTASVLAVLPGVAAAQTVGPSLVTDASMLARVAGSFVLVLLFGWVLLTLSEEFVDHAVALSTASPAKSIVYGLVALIIVVFFGLYIITQLSQVSAPAVDVVTVALGVLLLTLTSFGFTVVGVKLTEVAGERRHRLGVAVGAAISGVVWLVPVFPLALAVWLLVASFGVGGPTEEWLHAARDVDIDPDADA